MQIDPSTIGIVGGVLVALAVLVIYVENKIKEPEAPPEDYDTHMKKEMNARFNENPYTPEPTTFVEATQVTSGNETNQTSWRNERREGGKKTKNKKNKKQKEQKTKRNK